MHFCPQEALIIALTVNLIQSGGNIWLVRKLMRARAICHNLTDKLKNRPVKTIIYNRRWSHFSQLNIEKM